MEPGWSEAELEAGTVRPRVLPRSVGRRDARTVPAVALVAPPEDGRHVFASVRGRGQERLSLLEAYNEATKTDIAALVAVEKLEDAPATWTELHRAR